VLAVAEMRFLISPSERAAALQLASSIDIATLSLPLAVKAHGLLANTFADAGAAKVFAQKALTRFPLAIYFTGTRAHPPPDDSAPLAAAPVDVQ